jgi:hypothetical protein
MRPWPRKGFTGWFAGEWNSGTDCEVWKSDTTCAGNLLCTRASSWAIGCKRCAYSRCPCKWSSRQSCNSLILLSYLHSIILPESFSSVCAHSSRNLSIWAEVHFSYCKARETYTWCMQNWRRIGVNMGAGGVAGVEVNNTGLIWSPGVRWHYHIIE